MLKKNSYTLIVVLIVFLGASRVCTAQTGNSETQPAATTLPNLESITTGGTEDGLGPDSFYVGQDITLEGSDIVIPSARNDIVGSMSAVTQSSAMNQAILAGATAPVTTTNMIINATDAQVGNALGNTIQASLTASSERHQVANSNAGGRGGQSSPSDDSKIMDDIAWLSWEDCIKAESDKLKEKFNLFDAYAACGGGALQGVYSFEHVPGWRETKTILEGYSYRDSSGKTYTIPDKETHLYMRLSQFLFGKNLLNTDSLKGSKLSKQDQAQKDAMESFSSFIGDLIFKIEFKKENNAHFVTRWNLTEFTTKGTREGSTVSRKLVPRTLWIFNRTKELFDALVKGMHTECIGGVRMSSNGSGELVNHVLDKNPFDISNGDNDAYQAIIEERTKDIYQRLLKVNGYIVKPDIVGRLFLMWLSRRSQNPLNPDCTELTDSAGEVPMAYPPPQPVEFRVYRTNPDPKKTTEEEAAERKQALAAYETWRKANANFVNPEERRLLLKLSYNMAATDFYGQLISAYNFINKAPSGSAVSGTMRSAGIKLVLKQAGAENLAGIQEVQSKHLKAIEEVTRQLYGDYK